MTASRREFLQRSAAAAAAVGLASSALTTPSAAEGLAPQGDASHKELVLRAIDAAKQAGAQVTVLDVNDNENGTATAGIETTIGDQVATGTVDFVAEDGVWKLSKNSACGIVAMASLQSPACA